MPDLLVKLYELPPLEPVIAKQRESGVDIRRALPAEKRHVIQWVREHFHDGWADETETAFGREPVTCFIAVENNKIVGFAVHDVAFQNAFGPTGVAESERGRGIGGALLLKCLHAMHAAGFGYAIIAWAGPVDFYAKVCGATVIEGSEPGMFRGMLRDEE